MQLEVMRYLQAHGETSKKDLVAAFSGNYYSGASTHVGAILSRMVNRGFISRPRKGYYVFGGAIDKPSDPNQMSLFNTAPPKPKPEPKKSLKYILKKEWFYMILAGTKKEEYREIKENVVSKLFDCKKNLFDRDALTAFIKERNYIGDLLESLKDFDTITFYHAYGAKATRPEFTIEFKELEISQGKPEWGAVDGEYYFTHKLGKILDYKHIPEQLKPDTLFSK